MNFKNYLSIFQLPKRIEEPYSWIEHIPFAFFLIDILRPKVFVELGVHTGNSYNAFCQAVDMSKTGTKCYGVDTWRGDEHATFYDISVYEEIFAYQQQYADFSSLLRMTFDEARERFADGSIDLLHIDGLHTYEAVKHDFDNWLPKMSDQGVIILHDTEVREDDFGVWQVLEEISNSYLTFNFKHGYGLGIVAVGKEIPKEFIDFLKTKESSFYQKLFSRLGIYLTVLEENRRLKNFVQQQNFSLYQYGYYVQLFPDVGFGFNQVWSILKQVNGDERKIEFDLTRCHGIRRLRFDPLNVLTELRIDQITVVDNNDVFFYLTDYQTNALRHQENNLLFDTNDPQIYLDLQNIENPKKIIFYLEYITIGSKTFDSILAVKQEEIRLKDQHVQNLEIIIQQKDQHAQNLEIIIQQKDQHVQNLESIIQQKDQHAQNLEIIIQKNSLPTRYFAQLFVETASGFSEEHSIIQDVQGDEQQLEFDISDYQSIENLRFDPLNTMTALQINQVIVVDEQGLNHELNYRPVNAYAQMGEILLFDTDDSQILITLPNLGKFQKVVIQLHYVTIGVNTYRVIFQNQLEVIKQQSGKIRYLTQLVQQLRG